MTVSTAFFIEGGVCLLLPVAALLVWHGKTTARVSPFFVGALMFFVFALVLEQILHTFVLKPGGPLSAVINGNLLYKAVYGGLAAGLFEETGRLVGFKTLLRKQTARQTAITYGLGHGGFECILLAGVSGLVYGLVASGVISASLLGASGGAVAAAIAATAAATPLWAILERVSAMMLHLGLSIFVFEAVRVPGKGWLYPLAILLHAAVDCGAVLAAGRISSVAAIEGLILAAALAVLAAALAVYKKLPADTGGAAPENAAE